MSSNTAAVASAKSGSGQVASAGKSSGRPSLKNLTRARVPRAAMIGVSLATVSAIAWKVLVSDPHKRDSANFYK